MVIRPRVNSGKGGFSRPLVTMFDTVRYQMKRSDGKEDAGTGGEALHALIEVETSDVHDHVQDAYRSTHGYRGT